MGRPSWRGAARLLAARLPKSLSQSLKRRLPAIGERARAQALLDGDPVAAREIYRKLSVDHPDHPMHWIGLGLAHAALGDEDAAEDAAAAARRQVAAFGDGYLPLADLEQRLGRPAPALDLILTSLTAAEAKRPSAQLRARAAAYAERLGDDATVLQLLQPLVTSSAGLESETWARLLVAEMRLRGEASARRLAREHARHLRDAIPLAGLMEVYIALGEIRKARLLNRLLVRLWPHSEVHFRRYVMELARDGRGEQADRLLRQASQRNPSLNLERDFCERAYAGGDFAEAVRRYRWLSLQQPGDVGSYLAWGYALANVEGLDAAERHFEAATASLDNYSALVAMAHMAMRRRDRPLTGRRWLAVNLAFPEDSISVIEQARAHFDSGAPELAIQLCERWRANRLPNRGINEFHAWLMVNAGRFEQALASAEALCRAGPSWTATEVLVQSSGLLRLLDQKMDLILKTIPPVSTDQDARYLYSILRLFTYFEHTATAPIALLTRLNGLVRIDWAQPYLVAHKDALAEAKVSSTLTAKAEAEHSDLAARIDDAAFRRSAELSRQDISEILADSEQRRPPIHIINMFEQAAGGSELHALDLGTRLERYAQVFFWAPEYPHPILHEERGVKAIDPSADSYPRSGVLVFIGVYFSLGSWLRLARPSRILVLYNTFDAVRLSAFVRTLNEMTGCKVELLFCSNMMQAECGLPGLFEPSPIDLAAFPPRTAREAESFVIGRHSRDVPEKHSAMDGEVYSAMVARGARVNLLGATCMRSLFPRSPAIELRPAQRGGVRQYLESLDAFYYRTGSWIEPWGRVVIEAMAVALPVVVHERGGYAEAVESGADGFVFRTNEEAVEQLAALQDDPELSARIGWAGRRKVEALLGEDALKRLLAVYLLPATA